MSELAYVINHSTVITLFVFVMMLIIDYVNVLTKGKMEKAVKGGKGRQYTIASFLGATPGCLGAFMNVSFYVHGLLSFGAIVGGMIATSGDEAFVMLALFPKEATLLFTLLFVLGIIGAWISDKVASRIGIIPCKECNLQVMHSEENCCCFESMVSNNFSTLSWFRYGISLFLVIIIVAIGLGYIGPKTWRYLDFTKFLSLLKEKALFFNRADNFEDIHEGIFPRDTARIHDGFRDLIERDRLPVESVPTGQKLRLTAEIMRMYTFVNSWHINEHESSAMWKLYLKNDEEGVAIQSTYKRLRDCFKDCQNDVYIGRVKYGPMSVVLSNPELNNPELYKGKNFEHEREIRAVIKLSSEDINSKIKGAVEKYRELHNSGKLLKKILREPNLKNELFDLSPGKVVHIEPKELIEKIVVSLTAKEWFFNLVKSIAEDNGLGERVTKSEIGSWA